MKNIFTKKLNWWQGLLIVLLIIFICQFVMAKYIISNLKQENEAQESSQIEGSSQEEAQDKPQSERLLQTTDNENKDMASKSFFIETDIIDMVEEIKAGILLPNQIDEFTLLTDITAEPSAIHYHYIVPDFVVDLFLGASAGDTFINEYIKLYCEDTIAKRFLKLGINMKYSFSSETSAKEYLINITKDDCSQ